MAFVHHRSAAHLRAGPAQRPSCHTVTTGIKRPCITLDGMATRRRRTLCYAREVSGPLCATDPCRSHAHAQASTRGCSLNSFMQATVGNVPSANVPLPLPLPCRAAPATKPGCAAQQTAPPAAKSGRYLSGCILDLHLPPATAMMTWLLAAWTTAAAMLQLQLLPHAGGGSARRRNSSHSGRRSNPKLWTCRMGRTCSSGWT